MSPEVTAADGARDHDLYEPWQEDGEWHAALLAGCGHRVVVSSQLRDYVRDVRWMRDRFFSKRCNDCAIEAAAGSEGRSDDAD